MFLFPSNLLLMIKRRPVTLCFSIQSILAFQRKMLNAFSKIPEMLYFKPICTIACWKQKKNNCSVQFHEFYTARKSLPSDVGRIYRFSGNCFSPLSRLNTAGWFFCMSKHRFNNEQTDNVLKREKGSSFWFSSSFVDYFWTSKQRVSCSLSIKCSWASSSYFGDGFYLQNVELIGKERKYMKSTRRAGELTQRWNVSSVCWCNILDEFSSYD